MTYRYDIEGLRAVAVLLVVIFHINEAFIPGGFIGVDLFFVISGYVITQRIFKDGLNSLSDFAEFYRRRIRRITPVMLFVTAITLAVGSFVLLPSDLLDLSWSAVFASFSAANIYFAWYLDTSYFAKDSHYVPLLHLWSLGVEEQFYLVWPLLLFVLLKFPRLIFPSLIAVMVGSIAWGEYLLRTGSISSAYYMLPSRAFQLCAGGFCLFLAQSSFIKRMSVSALLGMGAVGAVLVAGSAYVLTGHDAFPGLNAVPVTLGGSLLLLSGTKQNVISRILSVSPTRFIGGLSYSMYLWHWPILAYLRYLYVDINLSVGVAVFVAIIGLSYLSTRFVEEPFRHSRERFSKVFLKLFALPTAALTAASYIVIHFGGIVPVISPNDYASELAALGDDTKPAYKYNYVCQRWETKIGDFDNKACIINGETEPDTLLWGDSQAAHYIGILGEIAKRTGSSFRNIEHSSCPPLLNNAESYVPFKNKQWCANSIDVVREKLNSYKHVILSAAYLGYDKFSDRFQSDLKDTISKISEQNNRITIVGQTVQFSGYDRNCALKAIKTGIDCSSIFSTTTASVDQVNSILRSWADEIENVDYIDFNSLICPDGACSPYKDGKPVYFDPGHISMPGSWSLGYLAAETADYDFLFKEPDEKTTLR